MSGPRRMEPVSDYLDQIEARVKPSRENLLDVVREAIAESWSDTEEYSEAPDYVTDAVLALLPGNPRCAMRRNEHDPRTSDPGR